MYNKKAVIGETLTWIVATVIILVLSLLFVFFATAVREAKKLDVGFGWGADKSLFTKDILTAKTFSGFLLTDKNYINLEQDVDLSQYEEFFNKLYPKKGDYFNWRLEKGEKSYPPLRLFISYDSGFFQVSKMTKPQYNISYNLNDGEKIIFTIPQTKN